MEAYTSQRLAGLSNAEAIAEIRRRGRPTRCKKTFHALRAGSSLKPGHASRLQAVLPESNLSLWVFHPVGYVLCHPGLSTDKLLSLLRKLPTGPVRELIWRCPRIQTRGIEAIALEPWTHDLRAGLEHVGTPTAWFALVARMRLEQLLGNFDGGLEGMQVCWRMLPRSIARSRHLLISKDTLIAAVDYFLSWQPFADARLFELPRVSGSIGRRAAVIECEQMWQNNRSVPHELKLHRRQLLKPEMIPECGAGWSWWDTFFSPGPLDQERYK
ncbi:hypothetical protein ACFONC_09110 [Luteimonas soli]|uniref:DUF1853 family protein n=1 Tax=Luteimonas soli TaxID=1648966 RepID=A0ABV7XJI0_9GAMM